MAVVLVTGCSSGCGRETALQFARRGDRVYASLRNMSTSGPLLELAALEGLDLEVVTLDVTDDRSVAAAVDQIVMAHGAVDILVNNAGVDNDGPVETTPMESARQVMETNFWGAVRTIRAVLPGMRAKGSGVIVNVTSVAARLPGLPYNSWYAASKNALRALTEAMEMEVADFGVRVASVEPGFFSSNIMENAAAHRVATDHGPYTADVAWMTRFYELALANAPDPSQVAACILAVADDPAAPVRHLVGEDAAQAVALAEQVANTPQWLPTICAGYFEAVAGPRPPR